MATILHIETSSQVCSVSVSKNGNVAAIKESTDKNSHAELVTIFSEEVLKETGKAFSDLDAIAVSMGPGSYTGLRIGVSTAKGFCFAIDKPLIAISTLEAMACGMVKFAKKSGFIHKNHLFCPMIDARRMEVYTAVFDSELKTIQEISAEIIDETSFAELLEKHPILFAGDGAEKCKDLFSSEKNAHFLDDFNPSSAFMAELAEKKFNAGNFENLAYFEPFYLKDFVSGIPKVKGLR
ncbi:MAG TPA: tRNA (adenosine(37)-N6)-threonylcarbamoyltransferase complex dimerization subunit type 1 TsaB [Bacteroidales bacterium]